MDHSERARSHRKRGWDVPKIALRVEVLVVGNVAWTPKPRFRFWLPALVGDLTPSTVFVSITRTFELFQRLLDFGYRLRLVISPHQINSLRVNHMNIGAVSEATSGKLLRDGVERIIIGFFRAQRYHLELN